MSEEHEHTSEEKHESLWHDTKFRWLIFSVALVAAFEISALLGYRLPDYIGLPFFTIVILAVG